MKLCYHGHKSERSPSPLYLLELSLSAGAQGICACSACLISAHRQHWIARPLQIGLLSLSSLCKWFLLRKPCSEPPLKALFHPRFEYLNIFTLPLLPPSPVSLLHLLPSFLWCWGQSSGTYISRTLLLSQVSSVALSSVLNATWKLFLHLWRLHLSLSL